jgi:hypothetical protein
MKATENNLLWLSLENIEKISTDTFEWKKDETIKQVAAAWNSPAPTYLLIPVLHEHHYYLLVIPTFTPKGKKATGPLLKIYLFDSFATSQELPVVKHLKKWLWSERRLKYTIHRIFPPSGKGIQSPNDTLNCGVFICLFTRLLAKSPKSPLQLLTFSKSYETLDRGLTDQIALGQFRAHMLRLLIKTSDKEKGK